MLPYLKVKIVSLALEAQYIRRLERRYKRPNLSVIAPGGSKDTPVVYSNASLDKVAKWNARAAEAKAKASTILHGLHNHRCHQVRTEARASLLAYGLLRGRPFPALENREHLKKVVLYGAVVALAAKYGPEKDKKKVWDKIEAWLES